MTLTIVLIVAIVAQTAGMILFACSYHTLHEKIDDLKVDQQFFAELAKGNQRSYDAIAKQNIIRAEIQDAYVTLGEKIYEQYTQIHNDYEVIAEQHKTLLGTWERIEDRYSDAYEQFKTYNTQFDRMTVNQIRNYELLTRQKEKLDEISEKLEDTLIIPPLWKEVDEMKAEVEQPDQYDIFKSDEWFENVANGESAYWNSNTSGEEINDTEMENEAV